MPTVSALLLPHHPILDRQRAPASAFSPARFCLLQGLAGDDTLPPGLGSPGPHSSVRPGRP
jgi:hypothetical protein